LVEEWNGGYDERRGGMGRRKKKGQRRKIK
jgi:hypothetical protein